MSKLWKMIPGNLYIYVEDVDFPDWEMYTTQPGKSYRHDKDLVNLSTGNIFIYLEQVTPTWGKFFFLETEQVLYGHNTLTPYLVPLNEEEFSTW